MILLIAYTAVMHSRLQLFLKRIFYSSHATFLT